MTLVTLNLCILQFACFFAEKSAWELKHNTGTKISLDARFFIEDFNICIIQQIYKLDIFHMFCYADANESTKEVFAFQIS